MPVNSQASGAKSKLKRRGARRGAARGSRVQALGELSPGFYGLEAFRGLGLEAPPNPELRG